MKIKLIRTKIWVNLPLNVCNEWNSKIWPKMPICTCFKKDMELPLNLSNVGCNKCVFQDKINV
jgi:hypothetical protein